MNIWRASNTQIRLLTTGLERSNGRMLSIERITSFELTSDNLVVYRGQHRSEEVLKFKHLKDKSSKELIEALEAYVERFDHISLKMA